VSVIDRFEEQLLARLRELRPLAIEYQQLERVARRLGLALDDGHTPPAPKRKSSRKATPTQRIAATAAQSASIVVIDGQRRPASNRRSRRQQDVLRLIRDRPGITVKDIATKLDVDATNLYRHVRTLQQDGLVTKHGTQLHPSNHQTASGARS
jgi:MarR family